VQQQGDGNREGEGVRRNRDLEDPVSKEIVEAVHTLEREKGI